MDIGENLGATRQVRRDAPAWWESFLVEELKGAKATGEGSRLILGIEGEPNPAFAVWITVAF